MISQLDDSFAFKGFFSQLDDWCVFVIKELLSSLEDNFRNEDVP